MANGNGNGTDQETPPQTIPTYAPNGQFVGFLAPEAHRMFMTRMVQGMGAGDGGQNFGNLLMLGSDSALAGYQLFTIGQLDSDFSQARSARRRRWDAQTSLLNEANAISTMFGGALRKFLDADDDLAFYQNRVIDGQLKGFWASALAASGRALGDLLSGPNGQGGGPVSNWILAAGGAFLLATLFDRRDRDGSGNPPLGFEPR